MNEIHAGPSDSCARGPGIHRAIGFEGGHAVRFVAKLHGSPDPAAYHVTKSLLITFLTGFLLFIAFALLYDRARNASREGPASTVYGEF